MLFNIMRKKEDGTYYYIGTNCTEVTSDYMAVKLTKRDAEEYSEVLKKQDEYEYIIVEAR